MAGPVAERSYRLPLYSGTAVTSLRLGATQTATWAALVACGLLASGCAVSGGLGNMFGKGQKADAPVQANAQASVQTGAQAVPRPVPRPAPKSALQSALKRPPSPAKR